MSLEQSEQEGVGGKEEVWDLGFKTSWAEGVPECLSPLWESQTEEH